MFFFPSPYHSFGSIVMVDIFCFFFTILCVLEWRGVGGKEALSFLSYNIDNFSFISPFPPLHFYDGAQLGILMPHIADKDSGLKLGLVGTVIMFDFLLSFFFFFLLLLWFVVLFLFVFSFCFVSQLMRFFMKFSKCHNHQLNVHKNKIK